MPQTFIVAEPGCTAQADLGTMLRQIDTAASCGANCFKNQWVSNPERMALRRHAQEYLKYYRWLEWPVEWHEQLAARCVLRGIQYACSIYLAEDAPVVGPWVEFLKISSFEACDTALIQAAMANSRQKLVVSLGMAALTTALLWDVRRLHCVSGYPTPFYEMNLALLSTFHGLSDHSRQIDMGALAVAAGAEIIETHFRLPECSPDNPDYAVAFSPIEFAQYIGLVRRAERIMGDGRAVIQESEKPMLKYRVMS